MRVPNAARAVIVERKLREYLLSESHPVGRFKAKFLAGLGFGPGDSALLEAGLRELLRGEAEDA